MPPETVSWRSSFRNAPFTTETSSTVTPASSAPPPCATVASPATVRSLYVPPKTDCATATAMPVEKGVIVPLTSR